jgi:hypothetical protein
MYLVSILVETGLEFVQMLFPQNGKQNPETFSSPKWRILSGKVANTLYAQLRDGNNHHFRVIPFILKASVI